MRWSVAGLLLASLLLAGCGTTASAVEREPEAGLYYPGSQVVFGKTESQSGLCIDDCHPARRWVELQTSASPSQVMTWYATALRQRGFTLSPYDRGADLTRRSWQRNSGGAPGYGFDVFIGVASSSVASSLPFQPGRTYFQLSFSVPNS
ncbi:MAG TPA: hypothetical protein VET65_00290 [Candidatus Limnocylindrales bacterium]|nr:hypothetical protein [Candidatus Limnocylindrales bacterium]